MCEEKRAILEEYRKDDPEIPSISQLTLYEESVEDIMGLDSLGISEKGSTTIQ